MRRISFAVVLALLFASALSSASTSTIYVVPTTTLAAQTSNNTSAANTFTTQSNGNKGAGNISKVDIHTLLYPGATTRIYAHMVMWFGQSNHMNIGYSSTNPAQAQAQVDDMVSRGIDGVIIDWYGPGNSIDQATQLIMAAAETHPGFTFAIMIDQGAIQWYSCPGCSPQQALIDDLQYIEKTYFTSPAYMTLQGQPVVTNFNVSLSYPSVNWSAAIGALGNRPALLFQNNSGFSTSPGDGSYSWVMPTAANYGLDYLSSFYSAGESFASEQTVGATYKGFNDTLASWGSNRIMGQQCGQTWLQTFSEINGIYTSGKPLPDLQLVTWNDYEEATEIESGIDNCFSLQGSVTSNSLQWAINGNENTVDHYTVYISNDGQNLMPLTNLATGIHSLNLCGFSIPEGNYQLFVQAVGKPTLANQITAPSSYAPTCAVAVTPTPRMPLTPLSSSSPGVALSATPNSVTIPAGLSGTLTVTAKPQSSSFNNPITLSCSGVPSTLNCSFSPAVITPGANGATSTLTISSVSVTAADLPQRGKHFPISAGLLMPLGLLGFSFFGKATRKRGVQALAICAVLGLGMIGASCGGKPTTTNSAFVPSVNPASYSVTINGTSGSSNLSTTVDVIVQ
ncbi:MAG TPA: hypothetical protein VK722_05515 [Candidatus Aquilonibacter sp.]|nr:hypothetical protein [Candidatus Aquilonibacter sp.]